MTARKPTEKRIAKIKAMGMTNREAEILAEQYDASDKAKIYKPVAERIWDEMTPGERIRVDVHKALSWIDRLMEW